MSKRIAALLFLFAVPAFAQIAETESLASGIVTGRVVCGDTNAPARFAKVFLKSVVPSKASDNPLAALAELGKDPNAPKKKLSPEDAATQKQAQAASAKFMAGVMDMMVSTTTNADGTYTFTSVPAGTYYVHATVAGYIDPVADFTSEELTSADPETRKRVAAASLLTATISGAETARADLRLERGAAISGRVLYDDGSPASGWVIRTVYPVPAGKDTGSSALGLMGIDPSDMDLSHITESSTADDTGHFRIAGLHTGSYVLSARFVGAALGTSSLNPRTSNKDAGLRGRSPIADMMALRLNTFSGNALRLADAKPIPVRAGEERAGEEITIPLRSLHSLSGHVLAHSDAHPIDSGAVEAEGLDAAGKEDPTLVYTSSINADGSFHFDYLPPAMYTLKTSHAADATTLSTKRVFASLVAEQKTTHAYGSATATVTLSDADRTDLVLSVPEPAEAGTQAK